MDLTEILFDEVKNSNQETQKRIFELLNLHHFFIAEMTIRHKKMF